MEREIGALLLTPRARPVRIELSQAQVDRVVRHASSEGGTMSVLVSGLPDIRRVLERPPERNDHRLSRSLLQGLRLLACVPADGAYTSVTELAGKTGMNMSTSHRYISTLVAVGLLERDPGTRQYRLAQ